MFPSLLHAFINRLSLNSREHQQTMTLLKNTHPATLATAILLATVIRCVGADFYVSTDGDDSNPGSLEAPFATLPKARDAVRQRISAGLEGNLTVLIRGGSYRLDETVVFGREDSGTDRFAIEYAAYPGETPVFTSGVPIVGWKRIERPVPGLADDVMDKIWVGDVPQSLERFHTLYGGSKRLPRARGKGATPAKRYPGQRIRDWRTTLEFRPGTLKNWPNLHDVEVFIIPQYPWVSNILPLASVDEAAGVARTAVPATYPMGQTNFGHFPDGTMWVENVLEELDEEGEWVVDFQRRRVYLLSAGDRPPSEIVAPRLTELIRVEGRIAYSDPVDEPVRNLAFRSLSFTQGDRWPWEADKVGRGLQHDWEMFDRPTALVRFRGAEKCVLENCRFFQSGGAAIRLDLHCRWNRISGNHVAYVGGTGILLAGYGPGTKDVNNNNVVTNNHIHHVGELLHHSLGIFAWQSGDNRIANNLIHHTPYTAIVVSGRISWDRAGSGECARTVRWAEIEKALGQPVSAPLTWYQRERFLHGRRNLVLRNEIHHAMQVMGDGNCIYISGTGGGNVVRENYLHDVDTPNVNANIRCDDDQHETLMERNVIYRCCGEGFISKGNNAIVNNMIVDLRPTTTAGVDCRHTRGYLVFPYGPVGGSVIRRNIFYAREKSQTLLHEGKRGGTRSLLRDCQADYNLYFSAADPNWGRRHLDAQREFGIESHSVWADPLFVDVVGGDLGLKEDSPAIKLGFEPIDLTKVGLSGDGR